MRQLIGYLGTNFSEICNSLCAEYPIGIGRRFHLGRHGCQILLVQSMRFTMNDVLSLSSCIYAQLAGPVQLAQLVIIVLPL